MISSNEPGTNKTAIEEKRVQAVVLGVPKENPERSNGQMIEPTKKKKRGGARAGAGAKPKYGCKTVTMRVPADMVDEITAFIYKKKHIKPKLVPEPQLEGQVTFEEI